MAMNRLWNANNPYQGKFKKVLCLCSAGLLRSPTAAYVLSTDPFNFNTRSAGLDSSHALIQLDDVLLSWADEIVVMSNVQKIEVEDLLDKCEIARPKIHNLNIPDDFSYRDAGLIDLIRINYTNCVNGTIDD